MVTVTPGAVRISLLAMPDVYMSSLAGFYDTFNVASEIAGKRVCFEVEVVAEQRELTSRASGMPILAHRTLDEVGEPDVVIVPTTQANGQEWIEAAYPAEARWLARIHARGTTVCSACSGALLLAEAGLLDGRDITTHWNLAPVFRERWRTVRLRLEHELVASGPDGSIITSGASAAWHDLALYIVARFGGAELAYEDQRFPRWPRWGTAPVSKIDWPEFGRRRRWRTARRPARWRSRPRFSS